MTHAESAMLSLPSLIASSKSRSNELKSKYNESPRLCEFCSTPLPYERDRRSRFCNHSCAARKLNLGVARNGAPHPWVGKIRQCGVCGKPTKRYESEFCSRRCGCESLYIRFIEQWKGGFTSGVIGNSKSVSKYIDKYLRKQYGNKCTRCGWCQVNQYTKKVPLQKHHRDGNCENNNESNLELLCPNCHSLTETFGSRNRGKSRRYKRYTKHQVLPL